MADRILDFFAWIWGWLKVAVVILAICVIGLGVYRIYQYVNDLRIDQITIPNDAPNEYDPIEEQKEWLDEFCEKNNITLNDTQAYLINGLVDHRLDARSYRYAPMSSVEHYCIYGDGKLYKVDAKAVHSDDIFLEIFSPEAAGVAACIALDKNIEIAETKTEANKLCTWHGMLLDKAV